ncbi:L-seryl-tRNA(Ser) seleniumtransferase [Daejeonella rubra]|uniref:L-seryl-tRNA(Ser) seleniumtransferase n=1 Tax=Daejeonella rubra TaxID=990371 RepID=A0A1G9TJX0_9SPHI|nr:aminotransferase class V-fold PLP-dependent enzyme [Daejeonella rubra]SDM47892.1 L-seryl-tRNA(Ser) seleniumtransferase [Daejeonella rubra]
MKRREILKTLTMLPLAGASGSIVLSAQAAPLPKRDVFREFGLRTFINASGYFTTLSGSLMHDEAVEAIRDASKHFCRLEEVQDKVGARIAGLLHAESAMVTAGAFSALMLGMAGVLSGNDPKKVSQIPFLDGTGMKSEVILQKAHNDGYAHALKNCGVKLITVTTPEELENAISEKTAMMYFINYQASLGEIQHAEWLKIAKKHQIPTMIDMAADLPPKENLWKFHDMGFDLVCVSGGKFMRGPQSTGILSGRKELIAAARLSAPPRGNNIGRGMKVNKEEIFGLYFALERFINTDQDQEWKMLEDRINVISRAATSVKGVKAGMLPLPLINRIPTLNISWDKTIIKLDNLAANLRNGNPSIEVMGGPGGSINVTTHMLKADEVKIVAGRIKDELTKALM